MGMQTLVSGLMQSLDWLPMLAPLKLAYVEHLQREFGVIVFG
jgi:hypothetical protein